MAEPLDITNQRFGRLVAIELAPSRNKQTRWRFRCDCGTEKEIEGKHVRRGLVVSCGCYQREKVKVGRYARKHGEARTPLYNSWAAMIRRCTRPNSYSFKHYGGRGITVWERWLTFENFCVDMGRRPGGRSIDRIDVNGNYEPCNCRWATQKEQLENRRPRSA